MVQLLIVDDEPLAVRSVMNAVDWEKLGVSRVLTAYSAKQAKEIFGEHPIDIMLCDIEMPQESGLELLSWVQATAPATETIFLTCHADFAFARKAIQLGSLDYLLKPTPPEELEAAISKAISQIKTEHELKQQSESWVKHHPLFIERFWSDILTRTIPSTSAAIRAAAEERNIYIPDNMQVLPVWIQVRRWHKSLSLRDEKIMEYALINALQEVLQGVGRNAGIVAVDRGQLLTMLSELAVTRKELVEVMETYVASCQRFFYCDLSCYIGEQVALHELPNMKQRLEDRIKNNIAYDNQVLLLNESQTAASTIPLPDMKVWMAMLQEGTKQKVLQEVNGYLDRLKGMRGLTAQSLHQFYQDFVQIVYSVLREKGIQAHQLFQDQLSIELSTRATATVNDMKTWTNHLIEKALGYASEIEVSDSIVHKVKAYITKHLDQDLNRENIASPFYLHPDYINRLFKKETGLSMTEYLLQERMRIAEELLVKTDMPITTIAANIGYSNLSHFAKIFRKHSGLNPNEFRQERNNQGDS
jgi:two-component system, response regulator YesN